MNNDIYAAPPIIRLTNFKSSGVSTPIERWATATTFIL
jgi:hypothetical protein